MVGETKSNKPDSKYDADQPLVYQIRIKGHLGRQWAEWLEGMTITLEDDGITLLTGTAVDQAALYGMLKIVRDLGIPLLSVNSVGTGPQDTSEIKPPNALGSSD